jgi:DNA (cytosine-5)-methyltransferase 1
LWQVVERDSIPEKYYLSATACMGILRRAAKRGRALPELLRSALIAQIARDASAAAIPVARSTEPTV